MTETVADVLLARLREWNIQQVFGYPATASTACSPPGGGQAMTAVRPGPPRGDGGVRGGRLRQVHRRRRGLRGDQSGPGAIHLLNGLYDAKLDHVPVVAIVGQTDRSAMGGSYQQEVDLLTLFKDVAQRLRADVQRARSSCPIVARPRDPDRARARRAPTADHRPLRRLRSSIRAARARVQAGALEPRLDRPTVTARTRPRPRPPTCSTPVRRSRMLVGQGARGARRGADRRSPSCWAPVWPRRCSARTCCPTTCRT